MNAIKDPENFDFNAEKDTYNQFLMMCLDPFNSQSVSMPDLYPKLTINKALTLYSQITGKTNYVFVFQPGHPTIQCWLGSLVTHPDTFQGAIGFTRAITLDQDLSTSYTRGRVCAGGMYVRSSTVSTSATTLNGLGDAMTTASNIDWEYLNPSNMSSFGAYSICGIPVQDGVSCIYIPEEQPLTTINSVSTGSAIQTNQPSTAAGSGGFEISLESTCNLATGINGWANKGAVLVNGSTIWGSHTYASLPYVTYLTSDLTGRVDFDGDVYFEQTAADAGTNTVSSVTLSLFYLNDSGVHTSMYSREFPAALTSTPNTATYGVYRCTFSGSAMLGAYCSYATLLCTKRGTTTVMGCAGAFNNRINIRSTTSFSNTMTGHRSIVYFSQMDATAVVALTGKVHYELVPNQLLSKQIDVTTQMVDSVHDMYLAMCILASVEFHAIKAGMPSPPGYTQRVYQLSNRKLLTHYKAGFWGDAWDFLRGAASDVGKFVVNNSDSILKVAKFLAADGKRQSRRYRAGEEKTDSVDSDYYFVEAKVLTNPDLLAKVPASEYEIQFTNGLRYWVTANALEILQLHSWDEGVSPAPPFTRALYRANSLAPMVLSSDKVGAKLSVNGIAFYVTLGAYSDNAEGISVRKIREQFSEIDDNPASEMLDVDDEEFKFSYSARFVSHEAASRYPKICNMMYVNPWGGSRSDDPGDYVVYDVFFDDGVGIYKCSTPDPFDENFVGFDDEYETKGAAGFNERKIDPFADVVNNEVAPDYYNGEEDEPQLGAKQFIIELNRVRTNPLGSSYSGWVAGKKPMMSVQHYIGVNGQSTRFFPVVGTMMPIQGYDYVPVLREEKAGVTPSNVIYYFNTSFTTSEATINRFHEDSRVFFEERLNVAKYLNFVVTPHTEVDENSFTLAAFCAAMMLPNLPAVSGVYNRQADVWVPVGEVLKKAMACARNSTAFITTNIMAQQKADLVQSGFTVRLLSNMTVQGMLTPLQKPVYILRDFDQIYAYILASVATLTQMRTLQADLHVEPNFQSLINKMRAMNKNVEHLASWEGKVIPPAVEAQILKNHAMKIRNPGVVAQAPPKGGLASVQDAKDVVERLRQYNDRYYPGWENATTGAAFSVQGEYNKLAKSIQKGVVGNALLTQIKTKIGANNLRPNNNKAKNAAKARATLRTNLSFGDENDNG